LALLVDACLKKSKLTLSKIDVFGVGVGPGSFTGLRIGISSVKGLSYALKKPCVGFSSLEAIAWNFNAVKKDPFVLAVAVDARRSNVYGRLYDINGDVRPRGREGLFDAKDFFTGVPRSAQVAGDILSVVPGDVARWARHPQGTKETLWYPTPESVAALTRRECSARRFVDAFRLEAVYYYEQDCQVKNKPRTTDHRPRNS
jgi:tRNA threonylcarbamoyl adenosine modification protein YeaZ